jgi:hypothetical protein
MTNKPASKLKSDLKEITEHFIYNLDETLTILMIAHIESILKNYAAIIKLSKRKYMKAKS